MSGLESRLAVLLTTIGLFVSPLWAGDEEVVDPAEIVEQYISAWSQHDVETMSNLLSEDIRAMGVENDLIDVWTIGKDQTRDMIAGQFKASPTTRSEILDRSRLGKFVYVLENAQRDGDGEVHSQCAMSIYEVRDNLIANVWYFSEQSCEHASRTSKEFQR